MSRFRVGFRVRVIGQDSGSEFRVRIQGLNLGSGFMVKIQDQDSGLDSGPEFRV